MYDWEPGDSDDLRAGRRVSEKLGGRFAKTTYEGGVLGRQCVEATEDEYSSENDAADLTEKEDERRLIKAGKLGREGVSPLSCERAGGRNATVKVPPPRFGSIVNA